MKKIIVSILVVSLLLSSASLTVGEKETPMAPFDGNTLYVGGSGAGNYSSIQAAINDASDGDTVFVFDDSSPYYESVNVDKPISLIGEDKNTTIINSSGIGRIYLSVGVTLSGFTILNEKSTGVQAAAVIAGCDNIISGNRIINTDIGIDISHRYNTTIVSNVISDNSHGILGMGMIHCDNNLITNNIIVNNSKYGILLIRSYDNTITNNTFISNGIALRGDSLHYWNTHTIEENTINGKPIRYYKNINNVLIPSNTGQIILANCTDTTIQNLILSDVGEGIQLGYSSHITIYDNIITNNYDGVYAWGLSYSNIVDNTIINNEKFGISEDNECHSNIFLRNIFEHNNEVGLRLGGSSNNTISKNVFRNNSGNGLLLIESSNNVIYYNNFINNTENAEDFGENIWDDAVGKGNYWDNYTGNDSDGDGIGDIPYEIPGGNNQDNYPLMEPWTFENLPPNIPTITGPTNGRIGIEYNFTFTTTDPDGDEIYLWIDWGDDTFEEWIGPYSSGEEVIVAHTWSEQGIYIVKAKAKDVFDAESDWGYLEVTMPFNQVTRRSTPSSQTFQSIIKTTLPMSR